MGLVRMKRVKSLSLLMLLASGGVFAQTIGVTVGLSEVGPVFYVDGQQTWKVTQAVSALAAAAMPSIAAKRHIRATINRVARDGAGDETALRIIRAP